MSEPTRAYVIGAGLAGLAAAVALTQRGVQVMLIDAARQAGGRCRSYHDPQLGLTIDNGNHLVLSGNRAVAGYLDAIGASDRLRGPDSATFAFADVQSGEGWTLRPNAGRVPWWVLSAGRRVPGTHAADYLPLVRLMRANPGRTIGEVMRCEGLLWDRLFDPFLRAALNTEPREASADLAGAIVRETLAAGGNAYRPRIAHPTLAAAFVDPALAWLTARGATVALGRRLRTIASDGGRVTGLDFGEAPVTLDADDRVILAVPPGVAADLLPSLTVPTEFQSIVNGHFIAAAPPGTPMIVGVIGGTAEWIFAFEDRISVTVSAADGIAGDDRESVARRLWADVAAALRLPPDLPRWQIVKEQRATFAATPAQDARRPGAATRLGNLWLAGDWTQTGLPATIEGAIRSGNRAAALAAQPQPGTSARVTQPAT